MASSFALAVVVLFLPLQEAAPPAPAADVAFQVSVYADVDTPPESIPYDWIDGLALAFINPVDDCGGFAATTFPGVQAIVREARRQPRRIAITFSIGGGGNDTVNARLESTAASEDCRQQFARQIAEILANNGLDGVDLDWEFPKKSSLDNYTLLVQAMREAIGTKTLSIAIYDDAGKEDPSDHLTKDVFPFVDYYLVEAYLAPRNAAIDSWINPPWSLPESQLRLGLAFFGDPADGGPAVGYKQLIGSVPPAQASPCGDRVRNYAINGLRTTGELTRFAMTEGLGGITGWALGEDRTDRISLLNATSETSRMWDEFDQWQPGAMYPVGTVVQYQGNVWQVRSAAASTQPPGLANPAFKQFEVTKEWSGADFYCGGDDVWFGGAVYRAVQDPVLSMTDLSPAGSPSLWSKLYAASRYDDSVTYRKGQRVYFDGSVYVANKRTRGQSPANAVASWSPFVDTAAFDPAKSYSSGAVVAYLGNRYVAARSSVGSNPVVATDVWQPATK